mgnify:CR=1 FL=1
MTRKMIIDNVQLNCSLEDIIEELQRQLSFKKIDYLQKTKTTGNNIMVCCPYHGETHPSSGISMDTGVFHCFACNETHSLPELISYLFGKNDFGIVFLFDA